MKASELIESLNSCIKLCGDREVSINVYGDRIPIKQVNIFSVGDFVIAPEPMLPEEIDRIGEDLNGEEILQRR